MGDECDLLAIDVSSVIGDILSLRANRTRKPNVCCNMIGAKPPSDANGVVKSSQFDNSSRKAPHMHAITDGRRDLRNLIDKGAATFSNHLAHLRTPAFILVFPATSGHTSFSCGEPFFFFFFFFFFPPWLGVLILGGEEEKILVSIICCYISLDLLHRVLGDR